MPDPHSPTERDPLDVACRAAARLVGSLPAPIRWLRLGSGGVLVELEWAENRAVAARPEPQAPISVAVAENSAEDAGLRYVYAPTVGTFYRAAGPDAEPFVREGDRVQAGQQVAILEAMKTMLPVTAEAAGEVIKILVSNGALVEYGERLIGISPAGEP